MPPFSVEPARTDDADEVLRLVEENELPVAGLRDHLAHAVVARVDGRIVGSAALEMYPEGALLRSVAVARRWQGEGVGRELTRAAIALARDRRVPAVYLLTTTAERYFPKFGFAPIARSDVPPSLQASVEFTTACPSSATVMRLML